MKARDGFLPVSRADMDALGWDVCDFIIISADAYVDHPSFGHALIARVLEAEGYRIGIIAQPDWRSAADFKRLGRPRLGFLIAAGNIDSMVNHYTAARKPRSQDAYSPGGKAGMRPDRASIVYCNRAREAYRNTFIGIGGVEASLRRFAHYDYWADDVRRSVLIDAGADILLYGMAERAVVELARRLSMAEAIEGIPGTCVALENPPEDAQEVAPYVQVKADKRAYAQAFALQYLEQDPIRGRTLFQRHEKAVLVQYPPAMPLSQQEFDRVQLLPYARAWHPDYDAAGGIPVLEEVKFSIANTRGCFGACSFCALTFHQGRIISARSAQSVAAEADLLTKLDGFKGYIHDIGGPTANFTRPACDKQLAKGTCRGRECLSPTPCKNLIVDHRPLMKTLRLVRKNPRIKKAFIRSGLRYDAVMLDPSREFLRELCEHHISGQLKVAPEHVSAKVLAAMGKPGCGLYNAFSEAYRQTNEKLGKPQFLVPYFMSSHPGCGLKEAVELAEYLRDTGHQPEQVQDFYPTPGTLSTAMFYTGLHPLTMKPVYVPRSAEEKAMQRALMQYKRPQNRALVRKALRLAGRDDLIGRGGKCLVPPEGADRPIKNQTNVSSGSATKHGRPSAKGGAEKGRRNHDPSSGKKRPVGRHPGRTGR